MQRQIDIRERESITKIEINKIIKGHNAKIGIFGVTGVGKSSLFNALSGYKKAKVSDISACTREPQSITIKSNDNDTFGITLIDVPGVGETIERDKEYIDLYKKLSTTLDLIIWVVKADDRSYSITESIYTNILEKNKENCPVLFVINQIDKIEPILDDNLAPYWDKESNTPKIEKEINILKKINEISYIFDISTKYIGVSSVKLHYNISEVIKKAVAILSTKNI